MITQKVVVMTRIFMLNGSYILSKFNMYTSCSKSPMSTDWVDMYSSKTLVFALDYFNTKMAALGTIENRHIHNSSSPLEVKLGLSEASSCSKVDWYCQGRSAIRWLLVIIGWNICRAKDISPWSPYRAWDLLDNSVKLWITYLSPGYVFFKM